MSAAVDPQYVHNPRARRYILRIDRDGRVRVTIPRGGSRTVAERVVAEKTPWILRELARRPAAVPWGPGTPVWFRGERLALRHQGDAIGLGDWSLPARPPSGDWRPVIEAHLRRLACQEFPPLVAETALRHDLPLRRVSIRNQRTRWGSCSRRGTVSLNWRLIQAPTMVRDYLIAHELAHLREMNHSPRFWRVVEAFFPAWRDAESWLRRHGRDLLR